MELMGKHVDFEKLEVLWEKPLTEETLREDFEIRSGDWRSEGGAFVGTNPLNAPGMVISRRDFFGPVMLDFTASTVLPSTHDINCMWSGSWDEEKDERGTAYVAGLQGWWDGKVGFEKSPGYTLTAGTQLFPFEPGREYRVQCGSIGGHVFVCVDGKLVLEVTDPDPIDQTRYGRIGFEAYCSRIRITSLRVLRLEYTPAKKTYVPEF